MFRGCDAPSGTPRRSQPCAHTDERLRLSLSLRRASSPARNMWCHRPVPKSSSPSYIRRRPRTQPTQCQSHNSPCYSLGEQQATVPLFPSSCAPPRRRKHRSRHTQTPRHEHNVIASQSGNRLFGGRRARKNATTSIPMFIAQLIKLHFIHSKSLALPIVVYQHGHPSAVCSNASMLPVRVL